MSPSGTPPSRVTASVFITLNLSIRRRDNAERRPDRSPSFLQCPSTRATSRRLRRRRRSRRVPFAWSHRTRSPPRRSDQTCAFSRKSYVPSRSAERSNTLATLPEGRRAAPTAVVTSLFVRRTSPSSVAAKLAARPCEGAEFLLPAPRNAPLPQLFRTIRADGYSPIQSSALGSIAPRPREYQQTNIRGDTRLRMSKLFRRGQHRTFYYLIQPWGSAPPARRARDLVRAQSAHDAHRGVVNRGT